MPNNSVPERPSFSYGEGVLLLIAFIVVCVVFAAFVGLVSKYESIVSLPMLSIAGIILLLICLAGISYVFSRAGLQDKSQALGLPQGSIQAVIALALVVLFAILSIFLFSSIDEGKVRSLTGLTDGERDAMIGKLASGFAGWEPDGQGKFTVFVRDVDVDDRNDIAKQLIVLIGTLMTSAVSFYFGSRASERTVPEAPQSQAGASAAITKIEPETGIPKGQKTLVTLTGTGLSKADRVTITQGDRRLDVELQQAIDTRLVCSVNVPQDSASGSYDVVVFQGEKEIASKRGGLTVLE